MRIIENIANKGAGLPGEIKMPIICELEPADQEYIVLNVLIGKKQLGKYPIIYQ